MHTETHECIAVGGVRGSGATSHAYVMETSIAFTFCSAVRYAKRAFFYLRPVRYNIFIGLCVSPSPLRLRVDKFEWRMFRDDNGNRLSSMRQT